MKPEEAIKIMQSERLFGDNIKEAHSMAIKALMALAYIQAEIEGIRADDMYKYVRDFQWGVDTVRAIIDKYIGEGSENEVDN